MTYSRNMSNTESGSQWLTCRVQYLDDTDPFSSTNFPEPTRPPSYTFNVDIPLGEQLAGIHRLLKAPHKIGDCTLQLSNTHAYLDLDLSISEQKEEFESFHAEGKRNSVILRTLLSLRVHACIEKLYNSKGRELRRALFSLKQVFQDDKDLVHQFVEADGLTCLIKVGAEADQNYQNYILRALGQIMLYIDGMEGVIRHIDTVRWLYFLLSSKFRLVVKTALKLLLVFVEYSESNAQVLIQAIRHVDSSKGQPTWHNFMSVLKDKDVGDCELLVYTMTLINKTLSNVPDQDTFYNVTDSLEEQKMDEIAQFHFNKRGSDVDLIEQLKIYEMALKHEDGDDDVTDPTSAGSAIKWNRERRKSEVSSERKSKRSNSICVGTVPTIPEVFTYDTVFEKQQETKEKSPTKVVDPNKSPKPWMQKPPSTRLINTNVQLTAPVVPSSDVNDDRERRRRERMAKWSEREKRRNLLNAEKSIQAASQNGHVNGENKLDTSSDPFSPPPPSSAPPPPVRNSTSKTLERRKLELKRRELQEQIQNKVNEQESLRRPRKTAEPSENGEVTVSRLRRRRDGIKSPTPKTESVPVVESNNGETHFPSDVKEMQSLRSRVRSTNDTSSPQEKIDISRQTSVDFPNDVITKDKKLLMDMLYSNQSVASKQAESDEASDETPPTKDKTKIDLSVDVKAIKERLKSSPMPLTNGSLPPTKHSNVSSPPSNDISPAISKKDSDVMWEKLVAQGTYKRLKIEGFDFSGLSELDDHNVLSPTATISHFGNPPPPPPVGVIPPPPPPPPPNGAPPPPPPPPLKGVSPMPSPVLGRSAMSKRRTIRLFWKESSTSPPSNSFHNKKSVWSDIEDVEIESDYFINLFLLKNKDAGQKKTQNEKKNELRVLDMKRSNAINIGMTILPPSRTIKSAIINMDEFALTKEQIDKLLTMIPTEEEISSIQEAMQMSPDVALGSAEQFLLTLSSISELQARLSLWAFKLDYDTLEKEVAEPLQDLKDAIEELKSNKTLRRVLGILRSIGNLLNGTAVKGYELSYLAKVPEIKDTVHKQTLLQHLTQCVLEKFPDSSDLYSELGAVTRCSRVDFEVLEETLQAMEERCKSSWDHLKLIAKHDSKAAFRSKLSDFLVNSAQKIIVLKLVHSRLKNRFHSMLLYFGTSPKTIAETSVQGFTRILSEFSLEYRTSKERVESQRKKRFQRGERNRTRGKTILETQNFSTTEEEMKQKLLENAVSSPAGLVERKARSRMNRGRKSEDLGVVSSPMKNLLTSPAPNDVTDQIMEQLVKTATQTPRDSSTVVNRRRRARNSQRKSLRRTLKNGLTDEEKAVILKGY